MIVVVTHYQPLELDSLLRKVQMDYLRISERQGRMRSIVMSFKTFLMWRMVCHELKVGEDVYLDAIVGWREDIKDDVIEYDVYHPHDMALTHSTEEEVSQ